MKGSLSQKLGYTLVGLYCGWEEEPLPVAAGIKTTLSARLIPCFTPHSSPVIEASCTVASLLSPEHSACSQLMLYLYGGRNDERRLGSSSPSLSYPTSSSKCEKFTSAGVIYFIRSLQMMWSNCEFVWCCSSMLFDPCLSQLYLIGLKSIF